MYRGVSGNPKNPKNYRVDSDGVSTRTSLSEPIDREIDPETGEPKPGPLSQPGKGIGVIDTSKLPPNARVEVDDDPPGHASIKDATADEVADAAMDVRVTDSQAAGSPTAKPIQDDFPINPPPWTGGPAEPSAPAPSIGVSSVGGGDAGSGDVYQTPSDAPDRWDLDH